MGKLVTKERLLEFFNDLPTFRQNIILDYLLKKHNLEIIVCNNKSIETIRTTNFTEAYIEAFHKNIFPKQGSLSVKEIDFIKKTGSLISDTEYDFFEKLISYIKESPSSIMQNIKSNCFIGFNIQHTNLDSL